MRFEELAVGQSAETTKTITETDIVLFAGLTGDFNPMHVDEVTASATKFGGRIAHGMLSASLLSATLGMKLPGPGAIYMSQSLRFTRPVRIGDTVTARVEVLELMAEKNRVRVGTECRNQSGDVVITGEATLFVPSA
jgi:3-hydroxybutyryl-CoA dehydratase